MGLLNKKINSKSRRVSTQGGRIGPSYWGGSPKAPPRSPFKKRLPLKKSPKRFFRRLLNVLVLVAIIAGFIFCLIIKPRPHTLVSSNAYHPNAVYETAANKAFEALRNKTKVTLDERGITTTLKKQFPEIDSIKIEVPIISQIATLRLNIAAPTFNFSSGNNLYVVGSNGVVAGLSSQFAGASKLPSVIDQSGFVAAPGKQVLGTEVIAFINTLIAQCQHAGIEVESLTLPATSQEIDLRVQNQLYYVKFYLGGDALNQAGQYLAAKHKFDSDNSQPQQYLDVRVAGKVYYK
ncbi:MAG: hypothetical protein Q7R60_00130 [bacterium]|nr:hypothetical protein [bacterium]